MNEVKAYDQFAEQIKELTEICNFLPDVSNEEGYKKSKRVSLDVGKILTAVEGKRKDLKADSLAYGRLIDSEAKAIKEALEKIQDPHKTAYKTLDNAKKEREAKRKAKLEERIADIRDLPEAMRDSCSDEIQIAFNELLANKCDDFYEYSMEALQTRKTSLNALSDLYTRKLKEEANAAELARLKEEAAIREEADKAQALREQAEIDARAVVEEELEGMRKELAQEQAKAITMDLYNKRLTSGVKSFAEKEAISKKSDEDQVRRISEAWEDHVETVSSQVQNSADTEHKRKINQEAMHSLCSIAGTSDETARAVITAIAKGSIPHLTINY